VAAAAGGTGPISRPSSAPPGVLGGDRGLSGRHHFRPLGLGLAAGLAAVLALVLTPIAHAQSSQTDEQRRREEYIQRALHPPTDPALAGRKEISIGTGFYVSDHVVLTNYHVIASCPVMTIQPGAEGAPAAGGTVAATDVAHDLALLTSDRAAPGIAALEAALDHADGSDLFIVGYPKRGMTLRQPALTPAMARPGSLATEKDLFQLSADVHAGNSGSPVLDEYGAVVGVISRKVDTVAVYQRAGTVIKDIGLAIPMRIVSAFLQAHHVSYRLATPSRSQAPGERLERARIFISQVSCWR
jgi:S1-C subfamily serine protease